MSVTVELRDSSQNAIAEISSLVWKYGGSVTSVEGAHVTATALNPRRRRRSLPRWKPTRGSSPSPSGTRPNAPRGTSRNRQPSTPILGWPS
jgi:hypothetical protein